MEFGFECMSWILELFDLWLFSIIWKYEGYRIIRMEGVFYIFYWELEKFGFFILEEIRV